MAAAAQPARYWEPLGGGAVRCRLCDHACRLAPGQRGICEVRENAAGTLVTTAYGRVAARHFDPVEKKPLYHFHPGSYLLTLGGLGCNLGCTFCQNWDISQPEEGAFGPTDVLAPEEVVALAQAPPPGLDCIGVAHSYNEPLMGFEFLADAARATREAGLVTAVKTNGFIAPEPLAELLPWVDAMNIDLKAFTEAFYRQVAFGALEPVKRTIAATVRAGVHVELTVLLIPGLNDGDAEVEALARWVASLDPAIPVHFHRYFPAYRMTRPPTPLETLVRAREIARAHLDYVYLGNVAVAGAADTRCPGCGRLLVRRQGYRVEPVGLDGGRCAGCGRPHAGVGPARSSAALYEAG